MNAGILLMIAYWVIFTVRKHFTPKLAAATKANTYDLNRGDPEAKRAAQRRRGPLIAAKLALRANHWCGWKHRRGRRNRNNNPPERGKFSKEV